MVNDKFTLKLSASWNSKLPAYRGLIRDALTLELEKTRPLSDVEIHNLRDLNMRPEVAGVSISIAHCPIAGGFAWASDAYFIGLDIEIPERAHPAIVARMSTAKELSLTSPDLLWVMKESAYKAYSNRMGLKLLSAVQIKTVTKESVMTTFTANAEGIPGQGWVTRVENCNVGVFLTAKTS